MRTSFLFLAILAVALFTVPALAVGGVQVGMPNPAPMGGQVTASMTFHTDGQPPEQFKYGQAVDEAPDQGTGGDGMADKIQMPDGKWYEWNPLTGRYENDDDEWVCFTGTRYSWGSDAQPARVYEDGSYTCP